MSARLRDIFSHWDVICAELIDGVGSLTQKQLDWIPPGGLSSIGDLLRHISETELWWIGNVVLKNFNYRDLTSTLAPNLNAIIGELQISHNYTIDLLNSKTVDCLNETYRIPEISQSYSLGWILWHTIEHEMRHRGQIFLLMRLQGITPPHV
jgi:uncharacterized damage-inducible protein DinB